MLASLVFAVALSELLLDLLGDQVNRGIKIGLDVLRKKIAPRQSNANRAGKLALRGFCLVAFQSDASVRRVMVKVVQLVNSSDEMVFDRFGQSHIMRR